LDNQLIDFESKADEDKNCSIIIGFKPDSASVDEGQQQ